MNQRSVLAIGLTIVMVLSLFALPVAGAPPTDVGPSSGNGNSASTGGTSNAGGNAGSGATAGGNSNAGGNGNSDVGASAGGSSFAGGNGDAGASASAGRNSDARVDGNAGSGASASGGSNGNGDARASAGGTGNAGPPAETGRPADAGQPDDAGPTVEVSTGRPADADQGRSPDSGSDPTPASVVNVTVGNVQAGERVSLDVSPSSVESDDVAFDGIDATVSRGGDFTMRITTSRNPLPGSPAFEPGDGAESLGRIRLDHSITNEEVEDVTYSFRVSKARLLTTDTDPETVALYRFSDGTWNDLPTEVVGETETHYLLRAESPGMSEFAIGAKRPSFDTWWASVDDASITAGESTTVSGRVTNVGGADGVFEAALVVDGTVVDERRVTVASGGTRQVNFEAAFDRPGTYEVAINEVPAGEVSVEARDVDSGDSGFQLDLDTAFDLALGLGRVFGISAPLG